MKYIFIIVFFVLVSSRFADAGELGSVASTCNEWIKVRQDKSEKLTLHWFEGFVSAYNKYQYTGKHPQGVLKDIKQNDTSSWLDSYCLTNGNASLPNAVESLIDEKKPMVKACAFKKSGGRPCVPYEEKLDSEGQKKIESKKYNWKFWE